MQRLGFILAVLYCVLFGSIPAALAAPDQPRTLSLHATSAAHTGANGTAEFQAPSNRPTSLLLHFQRLTPGNYWLNARLKSTGDTLFLGLVSVPDPDAQPDRQANHDVKSESTAHTAQVLQIDTRVDLPLPVDPAEILEIRLSDSAGIVLLAGSPGPPSPI